MSVFHDSNNCYSLDWDSSPWKPYYNKLTSRALEEDSGDNLDIKVWCAEEELENRTFTLTVTGDSGTDHLTSVSYPNPAGGLAFAEPDNVEVNVAIMDNVATKWWYGPGVAMQFPAGTHPVNDYTQTTAYTHTITASDIGERVYDGGLHCWMKLPHAPQDGGSTPATETDIYSKNIPMEYINNNDFLIVFNSYGHRTLKKSGTNVGLTVQFQHSNVLNASDGQFVNTLLPIWDDIDIVNTATDVNASYMAVNLITSGGFDNRASVNSMRFYWFTEAGGGPATFHGGQFIRVSLYPVQH
jgi:hypothetical protein